MMKDGEFAIYLGKEYSAGEIEKGKIVLRSTDIEDVKNGFEPCKPFNIRYVEDKIVCIKFVNSSEITEYYILRTIAIYKGFEFEVVEETEDKLSIVTMIGDYRDQNAFVVKARISDNLEPTESKKAVSLINSYGDDALEMFKEGKGADEVKKIVEGGRKTPSEIARSWQGKEKYPGIDDYVDITVKKGTVLYRGEPNGTEYFTTLDAIEQSGRDATKLFEGLQVEKNPKYGYRVEMQGYVFNEDVASAYGIANANPQFGK